MISGSLCFNLLALEMQSRPKNVRGYVPVRAFHEDPLLCPVKAVICYNDKVTLFLRT